MSEHTVHPVPEEWAANALIGPEEYAVKYRASTQDPENFWRGEAQRIDWIKPFTRVKDTSFDEATFGIRWFEDGTLNLSANCLDRHLARSCGSRTIPPSQPAPSPTASSTKPPANSPTCSRPRACAAATG